MVVRAVRRCGKGREMLKNQMASRIVSALAHCCKAWAVCMPLLGSACPYLARSHTGETAAFPKIPIKDPALWMQQAADQECPGNERQKYAAESDRQFGKVVLVYNPCASGTNTTYAVFENYAGRAGDPQFCAIGEVGGSMVHQLPSSPKGYVRIETYWHMSAHEGVVSRYELRPGGVIQLGNARKSVAELR